MIRVGGRSDGATMYAVAEAAPKIAMDIIRSEVANNCEYVEDLGPVTDHLLTVLHLAHREFKRV
jgi:hypothetical protein